MGRLFILVFFLAASGFTVVLHHCTEQEQACCPTSDHGSCACAMTDPSQSSDTPSVYAGDCCDSVLIAGGLKIDDMVVEEESATRVVKPELVKTLTAGSLSLTLAPMRIPHSWITSFNIAPPTVETYVLNSTFLI